jgi:hypothetical protein
LGGRFFELEELLWPAMAVREISRRGLWPAEFAVNQALWDWTRRVGELAMAAEGGAAMRCGGVGGDGSGRAFKAAAVDGCQGGRVAALDRMARAEVTAGGAGPGGVLRRRAA